jgi:type I restriction enzyme S subunit
MSFPMYPTYKKTGFEWPKEAPSHWQPLRLKFAVRLNPSKSEAAKIDRFDEVSFLPMGAIGEDGSISLEYSRPLAEVETGYTYFRDGDVTIAKITPCFENGKGAVMQGLIGGIGFGTTELIVARPLNNKVSAEFLHSIFKSDAFRGLGQASMYGAGGQKRVPDDFVRNFRAPIPPLSEQQTIQNFIHSETAKIDALVTEQQRLIELLEEKRQSVISHAVTKGLKPQAKLIQTGLTWLKEIPAHWELKKLKYLASRISSGKTPSGGGEVYDNEGVIFVRSQNVYDSGLRLNDVVYISESIDESMASSRIVPGDILLNITGASIGRSCIVPNGFPRANVNQHVCAIRMIDSELRFFVSCFLKSSVMKGYIDLIQNGAAREGLNFKQIADVAIPIPPKDEQLDIYEHLENSARKFDELIDASYSLLTILSERRQALISSAVIGQIDVKQL